MPLSSLEATQRYLHTGSFSGLPASQGANYLQSTAAFMTGSAAKYASPDRFALIQKVFGTDARYASGDFGADYSSFKAALTQAIIDNGGAVTISSFLSYVSMGSTPSAALLRDVFLIDGADDEIGLTQNQELIGDYISGKISRSDFVDWTYVYGTSRFELNPNAVITLSGSSFQIIGLGVRPVADDFDFTSTGGDASAFNAAWADNIAPHGGATFNIDYDGSSYYYIDPTHDIYTAADHLASTAGTSAHKGYIRDQVQAYWTANEGAIFNKLSAEDPAHFYVNSSGAKVFDAGLWYVYNIDFSTVPQLMEVDVLGPINSTVVGTSVALKIITAYLCEAELEADLLMPNGLDLGDIVDVVLGNGVKQCFTATVAILSADHTTKTIAAISTGDLVQSFDASGALVPARVTQILHNVTDTFLRLSNGTVVTPGHRYLRPDGSFMEIGQIVAGDGQIVDLDGHVVTVTAEVLRYTAETAQLFEEGEVLVHASAGGLALAPEIRRGWKTYNFTVEGTHTYIADGIRVHNDSILSTLKSGDMLVALNNDQTDAAVLRDVTGDGIQELVLLDGERPGANTQLVRTVVLKAPAGVTNVATWLENGSSSLTYDGMKDVNGDSITVNGVTYQIDIYGNIFDPGKGNVASDGIKSDDLYELATDDLNFSVYSTTNYSLHLSSNVSSATKAIVGGSLVLVMTMADGSRTTETIANAASIANLVYSNGTTVALSSVTTTPASDGWVGGTTGNDVIDASYMDVDGLQIGTGNDKVAGFGGDDQLYGQDGNDTIDGGTGNDVLYGGNGNDSLVGGDGDDTLSGGAGADSLAGGLGNDTIYIGVGDSLTNPDGTTRDLGGAGTDTMIIEAGTVFSTPSLAAHGIERFLGNSGNDAVLASSAATTAAFGLSGGSGNDSLTGNGGADTVIGGLGDDSLAGGSGNDLLQDDAGNDTIDGGTGTDTLVYVGTAAATVDLSLTTAQVTGYGTDLISGVENLTGGSGNDSLTGDAVANSLTGGVGDDSLTGGAGDDTLNGGAGNDTLAGGAGNDTIYIGAGDSLANPDATIRDLGGTGVDTMIIQAGTVFATATLGSYGIERFVGSTGDDNVTAYGAATTVAFYLSGGAGNDSLTGNGGADTVIGGLGNDSLAGGSGNDLLQDDAGNDFIDGGIGTDTLVYVGTAAATVDLSLTAAQVTGYGTDLISGVENLTGGSGNDSLTGDAVANSLTGGAGDDSLTGGAGDDTLNGGAGNDMLSGGAGNDTIYIGVGDILTNPDATIRDIGGAGVDTLMVETGTVFTTVTLGSYGFERFIGNSGSDSVSAYGAATTVAFYLSGGSGNDSLTGNGGADTVIGGIGDDSLTGGSGNDLLQDDAGNDTVDGGIGTDTLVYVGTAAATVDLSLTTAQVTGYGTDLISGIENLTGGSGNDSLTGDILSNVLVGGAGNDALLAGDGSDSLQGDAGNDTLDGGAGISDMLIFTGTTGATVNLGLTTAQVTGYGTDTILNIENVTGTASHDSLTGSSGTNVLNGGLGNDTLDGGAGFDYAVFSGTVGASVNLSLTTAQVTGYGTDTLINIEGLSTGSGNDSLTGNSAANYLFSGSGNDTLSGGVGADRLKGSLGHDLLYGGVADGAADVFEFATVTDSASGAAARDVIYDFVSGIDHIDFAGIDANSALAGDQAFTWAATTATANGAWYVVSGADILLRGDVNGDAVYDFEVQIAALSSMSAGDVIL